MEELKNLLTDYLLVAREKIENTVMLFNKVIKMDYSLIR